MAAGAQPTVRAETARRLLLGAQGLLAPPARKATRREVERLVLALGYVQLDSINAVGQRAHHLTLHSRLHGYAPSMLHALVENDRALFEHWTHDASVIPIRWYPHWKVRFSRFCKQDRVKSWCVKRMGSRPDAVIRKVRRRLRSEGALMARDFEGSGGESTPGGWWNWHPEKAALEYLWRTGEVSIVARRSFQRVFQLTEQALPEQHGLPASRPRDHLDFACREALQRLVIASPAEIARFFAAAPLADVRRWVKSQLARGEVCEVSVESEDGSAPMAAVALPDFEQRAARMPAAPAGVRLLSPFDPVLRDRARASRLFGFDYRFEAFVPEAKRRYGYYVLPVLRGEHLVGRVEPRFDAKSKTLTVRGVWWQGRASSEAKRELVDAIERLARFVGAERVEGLPRSRRSRS